MMLTVMTVMMMMVDRFSMANRTSPLFGAKARYHRVHSRAAATAATAAASDRTGTGYDRHYQSTSRDWRLVANDLPGETEPNHTGECATGGRAACCNAIRTHYGGSWPPVR
uniref:Putative secreted protein n=1 Tax=Anopheles marajoara TaxID=58244 RepID=A0A2M4C7V8_9DIPT